MKKMSVILLLVVSVLFSKEITLDNASSIKINLEELEKKIYKKVKKELEVEVLSQVKTFLNKKDYETIFLMESGKTLIQEQERLFNDVFPKVKKFKILKKLRYYLNLGNYNQSLIRVNYLVFHEKELPENDKKMYFFEISKFYKEIGQNKIAIKYANKAISQRTVSVESLKKLIPVNIIDKNAKKAYLEELKSEYTNERMLFSLLTLYKLTGNQKEYEQTKSILEY